MTAVPMRIFCGAPGDRAHERPDPRQQPVPGEAVLSQPDLVDSHLVGVYDLLQGVVQRLLLGEVLVIRDDGKDSEFHTASPPLGVLLALLYYTDGQNAPDD